MSQELNHMTKEQFHKKIAPYLTMVTQQEIAEEGMLSLPTVNRYINGTTDSYTIKTMVAIIAAIENVTTKKIHAIS